ncbi:MAG TPA: hypothetical protein VGM34_03590 [Chlamydiales bacterium]|jgi:hypothetical protein
MAAAVNIQADRNSTIGWVWSHVQLGLSKEIHTHRQNWIEWTGNKILWMVEDLPGIIYRNLTEARIVTVALTHLALYANSYLFYPAKTLELTKLLIQHLPLPSLAAIRFGVYISSSLVIIGAAFRAYGRFSNEALMNQFDAARVQQPQQQQQ